MGQSNDLQSRLAMSVEIITQEYKRLNNKCSKTGT
jgi:hypothetical protein